MPYAAAAVSVLDEGAEESRGDLARESAVEEFDALWQERNAQGLADLFRRMP